ncbi:MAG: D-alanyl-D-alanine carboxypeptidase/D-alanyl-D-alanine-endopeptidase [Paludibacter sp.]|nr:D-alanyl-D-alanine carboxypeptidase/D-alanyl-D-alanine-endopeptidase [Paludibacter sp.]
MKRNNLLPLLLLHIIFSINLYAQNPVYKFINNPILKSANISVMIKDMKTGKEICSHRPYSATIPASTMKVITTATALEILGPDFRYETTINYDGNISADGTLNGNLYIVGSGDPTLGSAKIGDQNFLSKWVEAVKKAGIKQINGAIFADESLFDNEGYNSKWSWDDIGNYYAPGIYALAYLDNTLRVTFRSGAVGTTPDITDISPKIKGLEIENNLLSSKITFDSAYFYGAPKSLYRSVRGEIPANKTAFVVKAELPCPGLMLANDFQQRLFQSGIKVSQSAAEFSAKEVQNEKKIAQRTTIYKHLSVPLSQIIKETNERSNNLFAEQIFKSLSLKYDKVATNKRSLDIIRKYWKDKGLDVKQLVQHDGSGLSPADAVSASLFADLMTYMYTKSNNKEVFFNSLPIAGRTGTLAGMLKNTTLEGKVFAKSGTIERVRSYTGYILSGDKEWAFAIMVNNANGSSWQTLKVIEDLLIDSCKK